MLTLLIASCRPDAAKSYEPSASSFSLNSIAGVWKGKSIMETDVTAATNGFPYQKLDVTGPINFTAMTLTLNVNNGAPTTFAINNGTSIPVFKINSGTWKVDDNAKPSLISLINGTDTVNLKLGSYSNILLNNLMDLQQSKYLGVKEMIRYNYQFTR